MTRVLFVAPRFPPDIKTGWSRAFARLVEEARRHVSVRLVAGYQGRRSDIPAEALGVDLRGSRRLSRWLRLWRATRTLVADFDPDAVVCAGLGLPPVGRPVVAVVRDLEGRGWRAFPGDPLARLGAQIPRAVVVPTQVMRRQAHRLWVGPWRLHRLPIGTSVPPEPLPFPARNGVLNLVHPSTLHPSRGPHISVDAVSRLPPEAKARVHLLVAGPAAQERYLAQLRIAAADQPITVVPDVPDLLREIERAHLVLYPTAAQVGFPSLIVEAMARGRPVMWPELGAMGEVMGGQGIRVAPHSVDAVRQAILQALDHDDLAGIGARSHRFAERAYGWPTLWPRWRSVIEGVSRRRRWLRAVLPTTR